MDDTQRNTPAQEPEQCTFHAVGMLSWDKYQKLPIETQLLFWIGLPLGSMLPEDWPNTNQWAFHIQNVCQAAYNEIAYLRRMAGVVNRGPDYAELKRQAKGFESQKS